MVSELIDEARYISNRNDLLDLIRMIYGNSDIETVLDNFNLVLVGGQALAIWHYNYFSENLSSKDIHYSFSDDIDFYGLNVAIEFIESQIGHKARRPGPHDQTVNLGIFNVPVKSSSSTVIIDVIESVGGVRNSEIPTNTDIVTIEEFEFPLINPVLCLKSRLENFFSNYKSDKVKELYRVDIALRCCKSYINESLDFGWNKRSSRHIETIIDLALSQKGCEIFVKNNIDILCAIDMDNPNLKKEFIEKRLPGAVKKIETQRNKTASRIRRFPHLHSKRIDQLKIDQIRSNDTSESNHKIREVTRKSNDDFYFGL